MIKILQVGPHLNHKGGVANYVRLLKSTLNSMEIDISYLANNLSPKSYHRFFYLMPFVSFCKLFEIISKIKNIDPDIVHLHTSLGSSIIRDIIFLKISKILGTPSIIMIHGWNWNVYEIIKKNFTLKGIFVNNFKKSDKILVLSKDFKKALVDIGIDKEKITITSTMMRSESYIPEDKTFDSPFNILFCSRIERKKGPYKLMEAIPSILEKEKQVNFIFMGTGPELENLKNKTNDMGIEEHVKFTGYVSEESKYQIFKKSNIFVFPTSYGEGFPTVIIEAMSSGSAIITTPNARLKYAIKEGKNGYFIESDPPESEEISSKILKLIEQPSKMKQISEYNIKEATEKYDIKNVSNHIYQIYTQVIDVSSSSNFSSER